MNSNVQYITNESGQKTAVIMDIADYQKIMEDIHDLAAIAERREEPTVPHDKFLEELKRDGLL